MVSSGELTVEDIAETLRVYLLEDLLCDEDEDMSSGVVGASSSEGMGAASSWLCSAARRRSEDFHLKGARAWEAES